MPLTSIHLGLYNQPAGSPPIGKWNVTLSIRPIGVTSPSSLTYIIERKDGADGSWNVITVGLSEALGITMTGDDELLDIATRYFYRVHTSEHPSIYSTETSIQFDEASDTTAPSITSGPTVSAITGTTATVSWSTDESSTSRVEYKTDPDFSSGVLTADGADGTLHSVDLAGLTAGGTYYYRVRSIDAAGNEVVSAIQTPFQTTASSASGSLQNALAMMQINQFGKATGVAFDSTGKSVVAGYFTQQITLSRDGTVLSSAAAGALNAYILKLETNGDTAWVNHLDATVGIRIHAVAIDASDNVIVVGSFKGTVEFETGSKTSTVSSGLSTWDAFIAKYDGSDGTELWCRAISGAQDQIFEDANCLALDASGNPVCLMKFGGTATFEDATTLVSAGSNDMGLFKLNASTGAVIWAVKYGTSADMTPKAVTVDKDGDVVAVGHFINNTNLGGGVITAAGGINDFDGFVAKYSGSTGAYTWGRRIGGTGGSDTCIGVATDPVTGNVLVCGLFTGDYLSTTAIFGGSITNYSDGGGIYIACYSSSNTFLWCIACGQRGDTAKSIAVLASGLVVLGGTAKSVYFGGGQLLTSNGLPNMWWAQFQISLPQPNAMPAYIRGKILGLNFNTGISETIAVALNDSGTSLAVAGGFSRRLDFGESNILDTVQDYPSGFYAKYKV